MWFEEEEAYREAEIRVLTHGLVVHVVNRLEKRVKREPVEYDQEMADIDELFARMRDDSLDLQLDEGLYMSNLRCDACLSDQSWIWRRVAKRKIVCSRCFHEKTYLILFDDEHLAKKKDTHTETLANANSTLAPSSLSSLSTALTPNNSNGSYNKKSKNKNKSSKNAKSTTTTTPHTTTANTDSNSNSSSSNNGTVSSSARPLTRTARKVNGESNTTQPIQSGPPTLQTQLSTSSNSSLVSNTAATNGQATTIESTTGVNGGTTSSSTEMDVDSGATTMTRKSARILKSKQNEINTNGSSSVMQQDSSGGQEIKQEEEEVSNNATVVNSVTTASTAAASVENNKPTNRRTKLFKKKTKPPVRCQTSVSRLTTSDYVFHRGFYLQVGDIVALLDRADPQNLYFAQIRAFLVDDLGEKSAMITWLVPTSRQHKQIKKLKDFEPSLFVLGPAEELPRPLDQMEFVRRLDDPMTLVPAIGTRYYHDYHHNTSSSGASSSTNHQYFDLLSRYKTSLFKHKLDVSDSATDSSSGHHHHHYKMPPLVVTRSYFNNETNENLLVETEIQCK